MKQALRRVVFGSLATLCFLAGTMAAFPASVFAAGENYRWVDFNTIEVSGGDLTQGTVFKLVQGSTNPERFSPEKFPRHEVGCDLSMSLNLTGANSASINAPVPKPPSGPVIGNPNSSYCHDVKYREECTGIWPFQDCRNVYDGARYPGISEGYAGKTVSIQGTRPGSGDQSETDIDKGVSVTVNAPNPANGSPPNITIQIKDAAGNVVQTATPPQEAALGSDDPNHQNFIDPEFRPVHYHHNFLLDPGKYLVCANIVIADCKPFEKIKFQPLFLEYGENSTQRSVIAKITVVYVGGLQDMTVGPLEVTLRKSDGTTISVQTNTVEKKLTPEEEQAQGAVTVNSEFGLEGEFKDMDPGTYEVCIEGEATCKEVTKHAGENAIVEFRIDWNNLDDGEEEKDCKEKYEVMGTRAITFLVCSAIDTGTYAIAQLDSAIAGLLTIDVNDVFNDQDVSNAFHTAWNSFRLFALGLLVIAALIMVVSQAAGLEILDAYTVKKVLPRLLFAALFISLSWDIMEFLALLSNEAGNGVRTLIYAPFKEMADAGGSISGGSLYILTLISTGAALAFGFIGLLSFVVTALLASLLAVFVLIFRKMLIILLVMLAPFAIASYVLPNTSKLWEFWKTSFIAVLVVFPIIMAFIAIGRIMSVVAFNAPGSATVNQLVALIAYVAPYFLITFAFRLAGGVMATVGGMANDKSKGAFDRLKNFRSNKVNENMSRMAQGQRFQGSNPLARGFNAATFGASTFAKSRSKMGFLTDGRVRTAAFAQQRELNAHHYGESDAAQVAQDNDYILRAQTYHNEATARRNMARDFNMSNQDVENSISAARANGGFGRNQQLYAAQQLFDTATGYDNLRQVHETAYRVAGENHDIAHAILYHGNAVTGKVGRLDLKQGFTEHMRLYEHMVHNNGQISDARLHQGYMEAIRGNDVVSMARGRPIVMENVMPALTEALVRARQTAEDPTPHLNPDNSVMVNDRGLSVQEAAREEAGQLAGIIQQYNQSASRYAAPHTLTQIDEHLMQPTVNVRQEIMQEVPRTTVVQTPPPVGSPPGTPPTLSRVPNLDHDANTARGYNQQAPRRGRTEE
jgi:hypothetical protein